MKSTPIGLSNEQARPDPERKQPIQDVTARVGLASPAQLLHNTEMQN